MNRRSLIALGGATAVAILAAVAGMNLRPTDAPQAPTGERLFPNLAARAGDVASVVVQRGSTTITLQKSGERWVAAERANYPALFERVRETIFDISQLRTLEPRTSNPELYAAMQVEDPTGENAQSVLVRLRDAQGADIAAVIAGRSRTGRGNDDDTVFVRRAGEAQAWLARGRLSISRDIATWLERGILDVAAERVQRVSVIQPDGGRVVVERANREAQDFTLQDIPAERRAKAAFEINQVGRGFDRLELDDVRAASTVPFSPAGARAELETFDGLIVTALFAQHEEATWVRFSARARDQAPAEGQTSPPPGLPAPAAPAQPAQAPAEQPRDIAAETNAINARLSPWAYKLPAFRTESLTRTLEDLLEPRS
jgi:hypothetical protein